MGFRLVHQALRYLVTGKGMLGMVAAPLRAFVRSREGLEAPPAIPSMPFRSPDNAEPDAREEAHGPGR